VLRKLFNLRKRQYSQLLKKKSLKCNFHHKIVQMNIITCDTDLLNTMYDFPCIDLQNVDS